MSWQGVCLSLSLSLSRQRERRFPLSSTMLIRSILLPRGSWRFLPLLVLFYHVLTFLNNSPVFCPPPPYARDTQSFQTARGSFFLFFFYTHSPRKRLLCCTRCLRYLFLAQLLTGRNRDTTISSPILQLSKYEYILHAVVIYLLFVL